MGSGSSVIKNQQQISCPNNYNEEKFYKILELYYKLEANPDDIHLFDITNEYTKNLIKKLEDEKVKAKLTEQKKLLMHKLNLEHSTTILQNEYNTNVNETTSSTERKVNSLEKRILKLETCTNNEKKNLFIERMKINGELSFDLFFEYMKDKADEIENINWIGSKKDSRLRKERLSINITTPNFKNTITP